MSLKTFVIEGVLRDGSRPIHRVAEPDPIVFSQTEEVEFEIHVFSEDGTTPDLTGCVVWLGAKLTPSSGPFAFKKSSSPASGVCAITLTPSETAALSASYYYWDLWLINADGLRSLLVPLSRLLVKE